MIHNYGFGSVIETDNIAFTFSVTETPRDFNSYRSNESNLDWVNLGYYIGEYGILPYGSNNDLPNEIRQVVQNNYIAPGLLKRKTELLWGAGPKLYKEVLKDGRLIREWVDAPLVMDWLLSFDYETFLLNSAIDFQHIQGVFTKFELNRGYRIGKPFIKRPVHIHPNYARLAFKKSNKKNTPTHVVVTDWQLNTANSIENAKVYPLFNFLKPFDHANSVYYSNMYTFCTDYYTVPDIYGSLEWLKRSTAVPIIFKALSKNSINLKYHIESPQAFWDEEEQRIIQRCQDRGITYESSMLSDYKNNFLKRISEVLSGDENSGKFLHTTKSFTVDGTNLIEHGWKINVIDQNVKDFVDSQIKISQRADRAVASGISLHSALGNMSETGKVDSGSEQHYALISYLNTGIDIHEMIVCKALNYAIKANFPNEGVKIGFYHNVPEKQQDVSPQDRSINNTPKS